MPVPSSASHPEFKVTTVPADFFPPSTPPWQPTHLDIPLLSDMPPHPRSRSRASGCHWTNRMGTRKRSRQWSMCSGTGHTLCRWQRSASLQWWNWWMRLRTSLGGSGRCVCIPALYSSLTSQVFDDAICAKWKTEAVCPMDEESAGTARGVGMTEKMVDWVLAELRWKAGVFAETGGVAVYDGDVVKSDTVVSPETKKLLQDAVVPLENVPDVDKDWHPGSDGMVLDLVHPSLFPLVYGRSRILPDSLCGLRDCVRRAGEGVVIPVPPKEQSHEILITNWGWGIEPETVTLFSRKFQWLPCDISLSSGQAKYLLPVHFLR